MPKDYCLEDVSGTSVELPFDEGLAPADDGEGVRASEYIRLGRIDVETLF
jgi:hypothetical protein